MKLNNKLIKDYINNSLTSSDSETYSCNYINKIGKKLWEGNFTSESITVNGSTNYNVFIVEILNTVYCIGSRSYGGGIIGTYASYSQGTFTYRVGGTGDTWTIDTYNKGGSDGTQNQPITAIYGLF